MFELSVQSSPVNSHLNIEIDSTAEERYSAVILNLNGEVVEKFNLKRNTNSFNINKLPQSIFILQVYNNTGNMQTFKLIDNTSALTPQQVF